MKGIIIYKSNCGSTKEYAEWISEDTGFEAYSLQECKNKSLEHYDTIIVGSFVIASKVALGSWIEQNWEIMKDKKVVVFSTSGAKPSPEVKKMFLSNSFSDEISKKVEYFPMHGRRIQKKLSTLGKISMWVAQTFIAKSPEEKEEMKRDFDGVNRDFIHPLVQYVHSL